MCSRPWEARAATVAGGFRSRSMRRSSASRSRRAISVAAVVTHKTSGHPFVMALSASAIVIIKVIASSGETLKPQAS